MGERREGERASARANAREPEAEETGTRPPPYTTSCRGRSFRRPTHRVRVSRAHRPSRCCSARTCRASAASPRRRASCTSSRSSRPCRPSASPSSSGARVSSSRSATDRPTARAFPRRLPRTNRAEPTAPTRPRPPPRAPRKGIVNPRLPTDRPIRQRCARPLTAPAQVAADNLFVVFEEPVNAALAAMDMMAACSKYSAGRPRNDVIKL